MKGNPIIVGLLGGIASGKSTVAGILRDLGAVVVDADRIAHEVLQRPEIRLRVEELLGPDVLAADGGLDRARIGKLVFADADLLRRLEAVVHPAVRKRLVQEIAAAAGAKIVVLDAPLLLEGDLAGMTDVLVHVQSPRAVRRARTAQRNGWVAEEHDQRESRQVSLEAKRRRAALIIENDGSMAELEARVGKLHRELLARAEQEEG